MSEWRTIESAPVDGTNILVWWPAQFHAPFTAHWSRGKYADFIGWKVSGWSHANFDTSPTHWMPLPLPPLTKDQPL